MSRTPNPHNRLYESMAVGAGAAVLLLGGLATKASASSEKDDTKNTPRLVANGLGTEKLLPLPPLANPYGEKLTPQEYKVAKAAFDRVNNGPANENIIDVGGMRLMPGTRVHRAPMESAVDHVIDKNHAEFWYTYRLIPKGGDLWAVARRILDIQKGHVHEIPHDMDSAIDPSSSLWVKVSQAEAMPGFEHLVPMDPDISQGARPWDLPPVYQVGINGQGRLVINQPHPDALSDPRYLANFYSDSKKIMVRQDGWAFSAGSIAFIPTKRPVRFMKAKPIPKLPANVAND